MIKQTGIKSAVLGAVLVGILGLVQAAHAGESDDWLDQQLSISDGNPNGYRVSTPVNEAVGYDYRGQDPANEFVLPSAS
ncbi:MAG: hypothetical protein ACREUV_00805 [Burkholderiales bacterium]